MAVPPRALMAPMASVMVRLSSVGPVVDSTVVLNGATMTWSPLRRRDARRRAAAFTMSMRRDKLWLLSMSSVKVVGTDCSCTRSSGCGTSSSVSRKSAAPRVET